MTARSITMEEFEAMRPRGRSGRPRKTQEDRLIAQIFKGQRYKARMFEVGVIRVLKKAYGLSQPDAQRLWDTHQHRLHPWIEMNPSFGKLTWFPPHMTAANAARIIAEDTAHEAYEEKWGTRRAPRGKWSDRRRVAKRNARTGRFTRAR